MALVSSEIYTRYVDKTYNRTNVAFFFNHWMADSENDRITLNLYLTQTTIVHSLAKLPLIGNVVKILSVAPNITF